MRRITLYKQLILLALALGFTATVSAKSNKTANEVKSAEVKTLSSEKKSKAKAVAAERLSIMTYNLENLFDTIDDPKVEDETFLPLKVKKNDPEIAMRCQRLKREWWREQCLKTDWTERRLKRKMSRLADVIRRSNGKKGPDVLIVQEVENREILERLRTEYLSDIFSEPAILIEGPDVRGIDIGVLTRLKSKSEPKLHPIKFTANENLKESEIRATRGILEVELALPHGDSLVVFGVHFPSQGGPTETRNQAMLQLTELMKSKSPDQYVVAGGDFNITRDEEANSGYFTRMHDDNFIVSHYVGCKGCKGTYYYHTNRAWSFFDTLIFSKNFAADGAWKLDKSSIQIFTKSLYQVNRFGSPAKFNMGKMKDGVSDHWPLMADVVYSPKNQNPPEMILGESKTKKSPLVSKKNKVNSLKGNAKKDDSAALKKAM